VYACILGCLCGCSTRTADGQYGVPYTFASLSRRVIRHWLSHSGVSHHAVPPQGTLRSQQVRSSNEVEALAVGPGDGFLDYYVKSGDG
jgi:hypothetical protein